MRSTPTSCIEEFDDHAATEHPIGAQVDTYERGEACRKSNMNVFISEKTGL